MALGAVALICALVWWCVAPEEIARVEPPPPPSARVRPPASAPTSPASTDAEGAWEVCDAACPASEPSCRLDCGLDRIASHPDDAAAWLVARIAAMRLGDEDLYRELQIRQEQEAPSTLRQDPWRSWGRFLEARAPRLQERGLRLLTTAGLHHHLASHALGVRACGISGPDFIVCAP
jgi:hypothetical protein